MTRRRLDMSIENAHINITPVLTKEQIAYEKALKDLKYVTAILKISQEGIDTNNISQEKLDIATKLFDEMDTLQRDFNIEAQKVQQDVNNKMKLLQEDGNKKFGDVQKRYRELIDSMKNNTMDGEKEDIGKNANIVMSKEREEELKNYLAEELARAHVEKTE